MGEAVIFPSLIPRKNTAVACSPHRLDLRVLLRGPGFLAVQRFGSSPPSFRQQVISLSQTSCVSPTKYIYLQSTTVSVPSSELGLSHPALSPASVLLPPNQRGGGHTCQRARGGESQIRRLEKKLSTLPTLWCRRSSLLTEGGDGAKSYTVKKIHQLAQDQTARLTEKG